MFSANKYSKQTLNTFEVLGGYVVNMFYNELYSTADRIHMSGKASSVTESFKSVAQVYILQFNKPELLKQTILNVHKYFSAYNLLPSFGYRPWVNMLVKEFVPEDYFTSLSDHNKDSILCICLEKCIKKFAAFALSSDGLSMIIDNHAQTDHNVPIMQDKMLSIIIDQREYMYAQFVSQMTGTKYDEVSPIMFSKLKEVALKLKRDNVTLKDGLIKCHDKLKAQIDETNTLRDKIDYLVGRVRELMTFSQTPQKPETPQTPQTPQKPEMTASPNKPKQVEFEQDHKASKKLKSPDPPSSHYDVEEPYGNTHEEFKETEESQESQEMEVDEESQEPQESEEMEVDETDEVESDDYDSEEAEKAIVQRAKEKMAKRSQSTPKTDLKDLVETDIYA